ncbi:MAG: serine/threonine-protein kinase [Myxococcota bacterium]
MGPGPSTGDGGSERYRLTRLLGRGGMAEVYEGAILGAGGFTRRVAIKRLRADLADDPAVVEAFVGEARLVSQLHHANIITVFDFGTIDGLPFQALEFVDGVDLFGLEAALKKAGQNAPAELWLAVIAEVAHALDYAHHATDEAGHALSIVHRDVSPGNVLVAWSGDVKLGDFGIASSTVRRHKTQVGVAMGKLSFMAPEQHAGTGVDARTDVFALGCVLHRMLVKKSPLDEDGMRSKILTGERIPVDPSLPPELARIISRAIEPDRQNRQPTAAYLAGECAKAIARLSEDDGRTVLRSWLGRLRPKEDRARHPLEALMIVDLVLDHDSAPLRRFTSVGGKGREPPRPVTSSPGQEMEDGPTRVISRASAPPPPAPRIRARSPSDATPVNARALGFDDDTPPPRATEPTVVNRHDSAVSASSEPQSVPPDEVMALDPSSSGQGDLPSGTVIGEYRLLETIGKGGFAHVYRAKHLVFGEEFAIKVLKDPYSSSPAAVRRLAREAMAMDGSTHRNLVRVIDSGATSEGRAYLVMELVRGATLRDRLVEEGALGVRRSFGIARQLAEGLAEVHARGFVHRDLKPKNIMLVPTPAGELVKILDFGLTRLLDPDTELTHLTSAGRHLGTARWMAPEQIAAPSTVGPAADLYALGLVLYAMVAGVPAFSGPGDDIFRQQLEVRPRVPPEAGPLAPLIERLLEKDPAARPKDAAEVIAELDSLDLGRAPDGGETMLKTERIMPEAATALVRDPSLAAMDEPAPDPTATAPLRPGPIVPLSRRRMATGALVVGGAGALALILSLLAVRGILNQPPPLPAPSPTPSPTRSIAPIAVQPVTARPSQSPEASPSAEPTPTPSAAPSTGPTASPTPSSTPSSPRARVQELASNLEPRLSKALGEKGLLLTDLELVPSGRRAYFAWKAAKDGRDPAALSVAFEGLSAAIASFSIDESILKKMLEDTKRELAERADMGGDAGDLERRYLDLRSAASGAEGPAALVLARKIRSLSREIRTRP